MTDPEGRAESSLSSATPEPGPRLRLRLDLELRRLGDEVLAYDPVTDESYLFNASTAAVLELCDGRLDQDDIVDRVQHAFGPSVPDLRRPVMDLLADLRQRGVVETC